uniref:Importin N-terminal domain-containing protein n=1 Tax=Gadus morhua TaxID=8049 RepID=A0A8C5AK15_GADMO
MSDQVATMCDQLIKAVNVMMDPGTNQIYRLEALKFCEEFKESCTFCVPCGLQLAEKTQTSVVRHFGLQILEHVIKFRWNDMPQPEKVQLKNCAMQLLSTGTLSILEEESHIKDVLSRITVEMIKREWPQHWPDMLKEMEALTSLGESQTELVMLILLRLAEDVITFQTLPTQRRRDIQQTLTQNMDNIFSFILAILQINVDDYRKLVSGTAAKAHCRVAVTTLNTLAGYIDWIALAHITNDNCRLLEMLCLLLSEGELQLEAVECLLIAISRKGKLEDRKPLMLLFDDLAINYILSAAQSADGVVVVERHYIFLKRLCQVLCALGSQVTSLVGSDVAVETPANLNKYMEAMLSFTTHHSQFLKSSTQIMWGTLFRHEILSKVPVVVEMSLKYLKTTRTNLIKTGYPSRNDSPSCEYSRMDFDSDEEFGSFFNLFRSQQGEVVRSACRLVPMEALGDAAEWLGYQLSSPIITGITNVCSETAEGLCSILSPSVVQWDAMTVFSECVLGQTFRNLTGEKLPIDQGIELLQAVLSYETKDPLILSCVLTNISALFPFVTHRPNILPQVLTKVTIVFDIPQGDSKAPRTRAVKNVRRHACSSIIKMCRDYSPFILPCFDMLYDYVKKLFADEALLMQMEKCALMEALVLIGNQFKDYAKQKAFLEELMAPVVARWTSSETSHVLSDAAVFLSYVGADQVSEQTKDTDVYGNNRVQLSYCLQAMLAVVKRSRWPADLGEATAGGFLVGSTPSGAPLFSNPCSSLVLAMLPNVLTLIRTQNNLFAPENLARLSPGYAKAYDLIDVEKNCVLGLPHPLIDIYDTPVYKGNLERMQGFFCTLYDNCYHILGNAGHSLTRDFYTIDGLAEKLVGSAFVSLDHVPDHRFRPIIHILTFQWHDFGFLPLVLSCPQEYYESLLCPLVGPLFTYMLQRLNVKWQIINQRKRPSSVAVWMGQMHVSENDDKIGMRRRLRQPTREVETCLDHVICVPMSTWSLLTSFPLALKDIYMNLLTISFVALSWKDTNICHRTASMICWNLLRQVVGGNLLPDAATWFLISTLKGLQLHGQHEVCCATLTLLAMLIYENLRPRYAELRAVMSQIPDINMEALDQYDHRLLDPKAQKFGDKKRKDQFKKLIAGTIGKALCEQFRKEVHIRNLPSLFKKPKPERDLLATEALGLEALFSPQRASV